MSFILGGWSARQRSFLYSPGRSRLQEGRRDTDFGGVFFAVLQVRWEQGAETT